MVCWKLGWAFPLACRDGAQMSNSLPVVSISSNALVRLILLEQVKTCSTKRCSNFLATRQNTFVTSMQFLDICRTCSSAIIFRMLLISSCFLTVLCTFWTGHRMVPSWFFSAFNPPCFLVLGSNFRLLFASLLMLGMNESLPSGRRAHKLDLFRCLGTEQSPKRSP